MALSIRCRLAGLIVVGAALALPAAAAPRKGARKKAARPPAEAAGYGTRGDVPPLRRRGRRAAWPA